MPDGFESADRYLETVTLQGAQARYSIKQDEHGPVRKRIESELSVIAELGCADYFLVIWDALRHARQKGILIGAGRGSAAGSIVNYCLDITQVDPLEYGLLFERFLNTNRTLIPCPDIDVEGDERLWEEMLCYLPERYGFNHVAKIANHDCGIVISPVDLTQHFPTTTTTNSAGMPLLMINATALEVEEAGFLKFDFIPFNTLTIIRHTLENIKQAYNHDIDLSKIPLDDEATLQLYLNGATEHTFYMDSEGMRHILRQMPSISFADLVAVNALYSRDWMDEFIESKRGEIHINHPIAEVGHCLSETYGLLVYQEQIMQLAQVLADFTPNESDRLRKALAKKKVERPQWKEKFVRAATANGYDRELTLQLWQDWDTKTLYLFNKSHVVCHTMIAFQTAYLKAHFPTEYMAAARTTKKKCVR